MANEITVGASLSLNNGYLSFQRNVNGFLMTQATRGLMHKLQPVTSATHVILTEGDIAQPGVFYARNLEAAGGNWCEIGLDIGGTFYPLFRLYPGQPMVAGLSVSALTMIAAKFDTADGQLEYAILEA